MGPEQISQIAFYLEEVLCANARVNLTAAAGPRDALLRHVADGLAAAAALLGEFPAGASPRVLDLGAGGGYIGMAIKIAWPLARVTLMESSQRKYRFLNSVALRCGLAGLTVTLGRAGQGERPALQRDFDAVVERALAPLPEALGLALPLTAPGGLFLAFQSSRPDPEEPVLRRALERHAAAWVKSVAYRLPDEERERHLVFFRRQGAPG